MSTLKGLLPDRAVTILQSAISQLSSLQAAFNAFVGKPWIDRPTGDTLYGSAAQQKALQVNGKNPLNVTGLLGVLSQPQPANANNQPSAPTNQAVSTIVTINNVISQVTGFGIAQPLSAIALVLFDAYANWTVTNYNPASYAPGTIFVITDRNVAYRVQVVSGSNAWVYWTGFDSVTQSQISGLKGFNGGALGANDTDLLIRVTDYEHVLQWSGSAWNWGPGDSGSGYFSDFAVAPTGNGWHLCDGSSGVGYLQHDGTLGTLTLPNTDSTPAYRKGTNGYSNSIAAAGTPTVTPTGTVSTPTILSNFTGNALSDTTVQSGTGASVAAPQTPTGNVSSSSTTPTFTGATDNVTLNGDPVANYSAITYFRQ